MAIVGYARVSTGHQSTDGQRDALEAAGYDPIFEEKLSGVRSDRPELARMLDCVQAGDTVVVCALDRLGRSLSGIVHTVEQLQRKGVLLRSLREGIDYSTAVGRMVAGIFAALAEYERDLIHERAAAAAARARGKHVGRPRTMNTDKIRAAQAMLSAGESVSTVCSALSVPRSTIYRTLRETWTSGGSPDSALRPNAIVRGANRMPHAAITLPRLITPRCVSWSSVERRNQLTEHAPRSAQPA